MRIGDDLLKQLRLLRELNDLELHHFRSSCGNTQSCEHAEKGETRGIDILLPQSLFRSRLATALYSLLPERLGTHLAGYVSRMSRTRGERPGLMDSLERFAASRLAAGIDVVVAGHVHRPLLKQIGSGWYLNAGDWIRRCSYAVLDDHGLRLEYFDD